jgi:hypothetical protein
MVIKQIYSWLELGKVCPFYQEQRSLASATTCFKGISAIFLAPNLYISLNRKTRNGKIVPVEILVVLWLFTVHTMLYQCCRQMQYWRRWQRTG